MVPAPRSHLPPCRPPDAQIARYTLEPLVNLARLHIRDRKGDLACSLLCALGTGLPARLSTSLADALDTIEQTIRKLRCEF
jgi:hypothetical protein